MQSPTVPFFYRLRRKHFASRWVRGVLRLEGVALVIEFCIEAKPILRQSRRVTAVQLLEVPRVELERTEYVGGWGYTQYTLLRLRAKRLTTFSSLPEVRGIELCLEIPRGEELRARELAAALELDFAERLEISMFRELSSS